MKEKVSDRYIPSRISSNLNKLYFEDIENTTTTKNSLKKSENVRN